MPKTVEQLRAELSALSGRRNTVQPEPDGTGIVLEPAPSEREQLEHREHQAKGGGLRLDEFVFMQREFRKLFPHWPNLRQA